MVHPRNGTERRYLPEEATLQILPERADLIGAKCSGWTGKMTE
ncbi:hypothetical protein [Paenibacillus barengoltzii]